MKRGTLRRRAPKSNLQRQREFRERNPHYYRDLHRKRKAEQEALAAVMAAHPEFSVAEAYDLVHTPAPAPAPGIQTPAAVEQPATPAPTSQTPLALPAARSEPLVTVQLPLFEQAPEPAPAHPLPNPADVVEQLKRAA